MLIEAKDLEVGWFLEGRYEVLEIGEPTNWGGRGVVIQDEKDRQRVLTLNAGDIIDVTKRIDLGPYHQGLLDVLAALALDA